MLFLYLDESGDLGFDFVSKKPYIYRINKKERALRAFYVEAHANRWMGALRTTHNGLTAHQYSNGFAQNVKDKRAEGSLSHSTGFHYQL
ncbi:MAG: hypothetical protein C0399_01815 [Syntrophus sp. (in: bacteria)]|nr:hypothetical protein [Syntrophus sp. (in: bacteria)]